MEKALVRTGVNDFGIGFKLQDICLLETCGIALNAPGGRGKIRNQKKTWSGYNVEFTQIGRW